MKRGCIFVSKKHDFNEFTNAFNLLTLLVNTANLTENFRFKFIHFLLMLKFARDEGDDSSKCSIPHATPEEREVNEQTMFSLLSLHFKIKRKLNSCTGHGRR